MLTKATLNCRLRHLFAQKEGNYLSVQDAYNTYNRTYTDGISLDKFGRTIKECFPTVLKKSSPPLTCTSATTAYNNENISPTASSPPICTSPITTDQLLQFARSQKCTESNWCVTESQNSIQLWKPDAKFVNGLKPCRVLTISDSLKVSASYNGVEIDLTRLGITNHINGLRDLENILSTISDIPACEGLQGNVYTETQYPALKATVESVCDRTGEPQQVMRSLECSQWVHALPGSKVARCTKCSALRSAVKQARWRRDKMKRASGDSPQIPAKRKRWDYMSEQEKRQKYNTEQTRRTKAESKTDYYKGKYDSLKESIQLTKEDHKDMTDIFNNIDSDVTKLFPNDPRKRLLWTIQRDNVQNKRNQWNAEFLDVCLQLWQRSKQGYADLRDSGFLKLPSERLLRYKKNKSSTISYLRQMMLTLAEVMQWMDDEARQQGVTERGRHGFIVFDEIKIQGSIQLRRVGDQFEVAGLVDLGDFYHSMRSLQTAGDQKAEMATHVCQLAFKGCEGFFFPFAWFPTTEIAPISIFHCHWDSVFYLKQFKFYSHACLCDGGQANRDFILAHFKSSDDAITNHFTINNMYGDSSYAFIMDPPHNIKKLRNNLEKSTMTGTARSFKVGGKHILWSHLKESYLHDKTNARAPVTSSKIKDGHFQLTPATRMRNHLAADVFSNDMLELLDNYQEFKKDQKGDLDSMSKTREYLVAGNVFVRTFANTKPIRTMDDPRLVQLDGALQWFLDWNQEVKESVNDALENMFGCVRASNGSNTNPTILQYGPSVNGYIHCRSFKVRNGNASRKY
ncbi:hypothetical protein Bbelb_133740 [Branchiostoma belcheri]|nr:hypothetical protein Bbelb_133740 [Branchiostoma belcheri]